MDRKSNPKLSDGTLLSDLINLETREVKMRALSDPELFELEMERIFAKTWVFLGHETEIPNKGDFVVRDMGSDSVLMARGADGEVHVSLNVCPHRGMKISTHDVGNTMTHVCIYHGWAFKPNGDFIGAPVEKECMHGKMMTKQELGLKKARVAIYGGLVFATWNIEGPSFEDFLGDAKWYFDTLWCRTDKGMEVLGPPQRFTIRANWKTACEQSASDGFHVLTLHRWLSEVGPYRKPGSEGGGGDLTPEMYGTEVYTAHAHTMRCIELDRKIRRLTGKDPSELSIKEKLEALPPPGITPEMLPEVLRRFSDDQLRVMAWRPPQVGNFFPNGLFEFVYIPSPDGVIGVMALHAYVPKGPDKLEFVNWILAEKDTPPELKAKMLRLGVQLLGTSGMVEQDDSDTWPHQTLAAKGAVSKHITMKYQSMYENNRLEGWPGPGDVGDGFTKDDTQWRWWEYWYELMTAEN
ncbi:MULTISPECIES: aromatic ring-hydroxylating dioxygenase subunit alpha [unclassified Thauera]|jgi:phenylpropionate dioxygenase-like ring-hydroxylating dioxygenase large terminal subunit|uniref:aromatic ring-hydroxylating dioxygenase subunit alpha n=1 Tax=unclassified Thauera TaxID=2609274 RepID=UPI001292A7D8|nr:MULTISPECIES: aromatic ring-hydroxylating dioxygenase subunit alpha [unclassified Thauera]KAI5913318.1 aromatic ring-hydroxylating dioxygenase subunit alpha [Thauera sp. 2A1]MDX9887223.1 aromatic ring-hydroxylating dioxygenase subunit alpha [Thauera sp.]